jgi:hypothetical protein
VSHKITIKTEITDKAAVERACTEKGWEYEIASETRVSFETGPLRGARLDLRTGAITGDSDLHSKSKAIEFGVAYSEALWMNRISEGGYLEERTVLGDGTIRLTATVAVA